MSKEEENLDMDLFSDDAIDFTENESDNLEILFGDEPIEEENDNEDSNDESLDDDTNEDTSDEDDENPESVVGNDNEDTEDEESDSDEDVDDSSSDPNLFNSLATLLSEKGLLSSVDSEISDEDSFVEVFKQEIDKARYSDLNQSQIDYLKALEEGIPQPKIEQDNYDISRLNNVTEDSVKENSELRQRIIYQDFINRGFSDEKARKYLQRSIDLETDTEDALESLESIKEFTKNRIEQENERIKEQDKLNQEAEDKRIKSVKKRIKDTNEVIKGHKISSSIKEKIEKNMFDVVSSNPNTNQNENALMKYRRENPLDFDYKLYYLFTITNGFQNFDTLVKSSKSTAVKDLQRAIRSTTKIKDPGSPAYLQDPESYAIDIMGHDIVDD